jgi:hypothetical protein
MLLRALRCTIATICIKIAHVVKVLRVEVAQLSTVTQRKNHRHDITRKGMTSRENTDMTLRGCSHLNSKRSSENSRKQRVCTVRARDR